MTLNYQNFDMFPDGRMDCINASKYIGYSIKTLAMLRSQGKGPKFIKLGRVFYFKSDLDEWIQKKKRQSTSQK